MADFILGRIKFKWRGDWTISTSYIKDDIVKYGANTYVALLNHTSASTIPTFYTDLNTSFYWALHTEGLAFRDEWKKYTSSESLIEEVSKYLPSYKADIVITGGEPLLYWQDQEFQNFLKYWIINNYSVTIETNGSIDIVLNQEWHKNIIFSLSVKLSNSGESLQKRINIKSLKTIIDFTTESYLKFVVNKDFLPLASKEIEDILKQIPSCDVYVMPLGDTAEAIDKNSLSVIEFAIDKGFKYSDRLHIRVWNNKRGV